MGGQQYTGTQCAVQALEIDDQHAHAWFSLSDFGGGLVAGQQYSDRQCYIKSLEVDNQQAHGWCNLGYRGGGVVGGRQCTGGSSGNEMLLRATWDR